jgi:hypothetical protein
MGFRTTDRYGGRDQYGDVADIPAVVDGLLAELETEQFEEPDDEHAEVSVGFGDWSLSVHVSGLVSLHDNSWIGPGGKVGKPIPALHRWATTRKAVAGMLAMLARGEVEALRAKPGWVRREQLPAGKGREFFRRRS